MLIKRSHRHDHRVRGTVHFAEEFRGTRNWLSIHLRYDIGYLKTGAIAS